MATTSEQDDPIRQIQWSLSFRRSDVRKCIESEWDDSYKRRVARACAQTDATLQGITRHDYKYWFMVWLETSRVVFLHDCQHPCVLNMIKSSVYKGYQCPQTSDETIYETISYSLRIKVGPALVEVFIWFNAWIILWTIRLTKLN